MIKTVLGEDISMEDLGGARVHAETTGNAHFYALSEQECFDQVKRLVSFIPWNNQERAKTTEPKEPTAMLNIEEVVPADRNSRTMFVTLSNASSMIPTSWKFRNCGPLIL